MEFPQLGQHCSVKTCNLLDFLPMKCDACSSILCKDHIRYTEHQCPSSYRKDVQIPICPLCNQAVPYEYRDQSPDRVVSAHIDRDCKSDPARKKREKIYSNKCSISSCKQREAIQVNCEKCLKTFCLRHRFPDDHQCQGLRTTNHIQEQNDFLLAQALQENERQEAEARRRRNQRTTNHNEQLTDKKSSENIFAKNFRLKIMDFGEPSPDIIAKLYNEIKEKKILELDWKSPGKKNRSKKQKKGENISPVKSDDSNNSKPEENKLVNEIDEFDNDDALTSNNISVSSFRSTVGKPKTNEKRLIDMNTVIANIERQQQEDERLRQGMDTSTDGKS